jgi:multiple sugar transport system substrate-binding protein
MRSKLIVLAFLVLLLGAFSGVSAQEKIVVNWFCCLGSGDSPEQQEAQNQVVADFNASQSEIELVLTVVDFDVSRDTFSTLLAAGTPPDIVGPVGVGGSNDYIELWLDLQPLVDESGFDLSIFDPALVDLYRTPEGGLVGIPFGVFPTLTYYNRGLFDEAGLNYPPQEFDAPYVMPDGTEVEWNYDTVAELAKILTVDANGNDATSPDLDPANLVQFGLNFQWAQQRLMFTHFQPATVYDPATGEVTLPEAWRTAAQWMKDGLWTDHFMVTTAYDDSELLGPGNAFSTGNVAMTIAPLWFTCCLAGSVDNFEWDVAVVPKSFDGEFHVATDADTFRVLNTTQNPEAAFTVLSYLLTDAVGILAPTYGAFPAYPDAQGTYFEGRDQTYPFGINWQVAINSLAYNNPMDQHHESWLPNNTKAAERIQTFVSLLYSDSGADIDLNAEFDTLQADLQAIIDEVQ